MGNVYLFTKQELSPAITLPKELWDEEIIEMKTYLEELIDRINEKSVELRKHVQERDELAKNVEFSKEGINHLEEESSKRRKSKKKKKKFRVKVVKDGQKKVKAELLANH